MIDIEHIARISYGKDSLKMLAVIKSRGLPLDRITTTDVWATDTISANLPPMEEFKARMDQRIWDMYHIEVEHLCARNKDGSKRTYEQMFYHVPVRRSQTVQVERERHRTQGEVTGFPPNAFYNWCQKLKIVQECNQRISSCVRDYILPETQSPCADTKDFRNKSPPGAENSKSTRSGPLFSRARPINAQRQKYCGVHWNCCR